MPERIVIFTEEPSMKAYLEVLLPRVLNTEVMFQIVPFEGKSDLDKNVLPKMKHWVDREVRFLILRDQDGRDCLELKSFLRNLGSLANRDDCIIRIVCNELESCHVADLQVVEKAYELQNFAARHQHKAKLRNPDLILKPSQKLSQLLPQYQKIDGSRRIAQHVDLDNARSRSFGLFVQTLRNLAKEQAKQA